MSKLTEQLRAHGIINAQDFKSGRGRLNENYPLDRPVPRCRLYAGRRSVPSIWFKAADVGRGGWGAEWVVTQPGVDLDPGAHWRHKHYDTVTVDKTFYVYGRTDRAEQFTVATEWASEHFGVTEWKRTPYGDWMPADFVDSRLKQLKDWIKSLPEEATSDVG